MARGQGTINVKFLADVADLKKGLTTAGDEVGGFGDKMKGMAGNVVGALGALGVASFLKDATAAAAEDEAAHEKLATSLRNSMGAWDGQVDSIEKWITKAQFAKGFSDTDLRTAFAGLTEVTHNVSDSQDLMGTAMDLARAKGIPLAQAADILAKAHEGNTKAVKAQLPEIGKLIADNASAEEIIAAVTSTVKGQAATFAGTAAGKAEIFHQKMGELTETIGAKLLPVVSTLADWLSKVVDFFSDLPGPVQTGIVVVGGIAVALFGLNSVLGLATAAAAAFGVTLNLSLGPIALVVAAIVGIGLAIYALVKNWDTIKEVASTAMGVILGAVEGAFNWVKENWPLILAILTGPIGLAVLAIITHWDTIKGGFTAVKDWIGERVGDIVGFITGIPARIGAVATTMWDAVKTSFTGVKDWVWGRLGDIVAFFTGMPTRIGEVTAGMWDGIKEAFRATFNWIIDKWNGLEFTVPSVDTHIPGVGKIGGFTLGVPDIPRLAGGGAFSGAAIVGEKGPELVAGAGTVIPNSRLGGGPTLVANFYGPQDPAGVARQLEELLYRYQQQGGTLRFNT